MGGPANIQTGQLLRILSDAIGREITHEYVEPRAFGELMYTKVGADKFAPRAPFVDHFDSFYGFNLHSPYHPMEVDMNPVLERLPVELTPLDVWAKRQDWRQQAAINTGSLAG